MLAAMSPAKFEELAALEELWPRDDGWAQAAMIACVVHNALEDVRQAIIQGNGGKYRPQYADPSKFHPGEGMKQAKQPQRIEDVKSTILGAFSMQPNGNRH